MDRGSLGPRGQKSKVAWIAGGIASALLLFMAENIWIDTWLRHKSHRIPSFVPEAESGVWFLVLAVGGIALTLLIVCLALLLKDRDTTLWMKLGIGIAVILVMLMGVEWFRVTNGQSGIVKLLLSFGTHTVTLTWQASTSPVAGYYVYRSTTPGANYVRIQTTLIQGLSFTDASVQSGVTYYYVARAVDARGRESVNSNETKATIP